VLILDIQDFKFEKGLAGLAPNIVFSLKSRSLSQKFQNQVLKQGRHPCCAAQYSLESFCLYFSRYILDRATLEVLDQGL
jgi:hypothetical protein